ncbi:MAG: hypothetical protein KDK51_03380 [Deltaproteobacteria bacterium]|nr:hypothetical protein [Deltaproteobacteria bacterium]
MQLPWFALKMLSIHWPFVLASAISQYTRIYSTKKDHPKKQDFLFAPYNAVIRMHFMIFLFAGLKAIQMQNFVFYAVVLFAYFFPWQSIFLTCRDMRKPV